MGVIIYFLYFHHQHEDGHVHADGTVHGANSKEQNSSEENHDEESLDIKSIHLSEAQFKNAEIALGSFEKKNLSEVVKANGYTKLPPQNQAHINALFNGTISTIKVSEGQAVKVGQVLATMKSLSYNNLRLEKEKMQLELNVAKANFDYLKLEYHRQKELAQDNVNATKVFQKVESDFRAEETKIATIQNQLMIIDQNIKMAGGSTSPTIQIVSPISGFISEINVHIGSSTESGKSLFTVIDNSKLHIDLMIFEKDLFKVKVGQPIRFTLTNQGSQEFNGKVFSIGKSFESDSKAIAVHADMNNDKQKLIPGMYVNALIDIGTSVVDALPSKAIVNADGRQFIFIQQIPEKQESSNGNEYVFNRVEVKTGVSHLGYTQVTPLEELPKNTKIVLNGAFYLQSHLYKSEGGGEHHH
jgi:cobalt-zinc-cadmium efflux system membrane fusion protein